MHVAACPSTNPWLNFPVRIQRVTVETQGVSTYDLVFTDKLLAQRYSFRPGQFNMLYLPGVGEIAISISGNPADCSQLPHTIRAAGLVTQALARTRPGSVLGLRGPFGSSWPMDQCRGRDIVLVAGGIGLAPLRSVICELLANRDDYGSLTLLHGARMPAGLLYPYEYDNWRAQGLDVQTTVDRGPFGWPGHVGVVTQLLDRLDLPQPANTLLMTCGPEVMMWYTVRSALQLGLPAESVFVSLERHMNCAVGFCGHCQLGPEFVCKDGPVFPYNRVARFLKVNDL